MRAMISSTREISAPFSKRMWPASAATSSTSDKSYFRSMPLECIVPHILPGDRIAAQDEEALHHVAELADVAGP